MQPTLLVLAAGMGSRYGGLKQMDPMGRNGETVMDYSVYDAIRAGFGLVVFIIRDDFAEAFASYVHSVTMKRPFLIRIHHNGKQVKSFDACWSLPRCADKRQLIEQLLEAKVTVNQSTPPFGK